MKNLELIATIGANNEIGINNNQIWNIEENLNFFYKITKDKNIIMGRKTFEKIPYSMLSGRSLFVLSTSELDKNYDVNSFNNFFSLMQYIELSNCQFVVLGGSSIYEQFLPFVDTMYLNEVIDYVKADAYFPIFNFDDWNIEMMENHFNNNTSYTPYIKNKYTRKRVK